MLRDVLSSVGFVRLQGSSMAQFGSEILRRKDMWATMNREQRRLQNTRNWEQLPVHYKVLHKENKDCESAWVRQAFLDHQPQTMTQELIINYECLVFA